MSASAFVLVTELPTHYLLISVSTATGNDPFHPIYFPSIAGYVHFFKEFGTFSIFSFLYFCDFYLFYMFFVTVHRMWKFNTVATSGK